MDPSFAEEIKQRLEIEKSRKHYPDGFPALPPIPAARYCDPAFFRLEREYVFGRNWLFVAHADELPEVGDVVLLDQFPAPVMLVRGEDRCVRAFYNTCRHRGAPMVSETRNKVKTRPVCQYHSLSYVLEGGLTTRNNFLRAGNDTVYQKNIIKTKIKK